MQEGHSKRSPQVAANQLVGLFKIFHNPLATLPRKQHLKPVIDLREIRENVECEERNKNDIKNLCHDAGNAAHENKDRIEEILQNILYFGSQACGEHRPNLLGGDSIPFQGIQEIASSDIVAGIGHQFGRCIENPFKLRDGDGKNKEQDQRNSA